MQRNGQKRDKNLRKKQQGLFFFFFLPGGLLRKQGPRRARLRGAPLPRSHNALVATSCLAFISFFVKSF
jgi:hypothetical protein